jgi:hypothetical protein
VEKTSCLRSSGFFSVFAPFLNSKLPIPHSQFRAAVNNPKFNIQNSTLPRSGQAIQYPKSIIASLPLSSFSLQVSSFSSAFLIAAQRPSHPKSNIQN